MPQTGVPTTTRSLGCGIAPPRGAIAAGALPPRFHEATAGSRQRPVRALGSENFFDVAVERPGQIRRDLPRPPRPGKIDDENALFHLKPLYAGLTTPERGRGR